MKKLVIFVIFFLLRSTTYSQSSWQLQHPSPQAYHHNSIYAFNSQHAFAVGDFNSVIETIDSGKTWTSTPLDFQGQNYRSLHTITFTDSLNGWAGGSLFSIFRTNDGGKSWNEQRPINILKGLCTKIQFLNKDTGWAVGYKYDSTAEDQAGNISLYDMTSGGIMLHTVDGGITWEEIALPDNTPPLLDIHFLDSDNGWACSSNRSLVRTNDGGKKWFSNAIFSLWNTTFGKLLTSIQLVSPTTAFVANGDGKIFRTTNWGGGWQQVSISGSFNVRMGSLVHFIDSLEGFAFSNHNYYFNTLDGGNTWKKVTFPSSILDSDFETGGTFRSITVANDSSIWLAGKFGLLFTSGDRGVNWRRVSSSNEKISQLHFINSKHGWALGTARTLLATSNSGKTWKQVFQNNESLQIENVFFLDENNGWVSDFNIALKKFTVLNTVDGGKTWQKLYSDAQTQFKSIHFFNETSGIAIQQKLGTPFIVVTNDGGKTWTQTMNFNTGITPFAMSFTNQTNGWLVGTAGTLLHTVNGGITWEMVDAGTKLGLYALHFRDSLHGWVAGQQGIMLSTNDGGITWQNKTQMLITDHIQSIRFTDAQHGVIANNKLWETSDGGLNWKEAFTKGSSTEYNLSILFVTSTSDGSIWASGDKGYILHKAGNPTRILEWNYADQSKILKISPNPATASTRIEINNNESGQLYLTDFRGNLILTIQIEFVDYRFMAEFDTTLLSSGTYFLQWKSGRKSETLPIIIAR